MDTLHTNTIDEAIANLEKTSEALELVANKKANYNSEFSRYLDVISFEMRRQASTLRECKYAFGNIS